MSDKEIISGRQLAPLIFTFVISDATIFVPSFVTKHAGQDGWLSVLIGGFFGVITVLVVTALGKKYPNKTLMEYSEIILGKWPGKILGLIYICFFIHVSSVFVREISTTIHITMLPKSSLEPITLTLFIVCSYSVKKGLEAITRVNILVLVVIYIAIFTVLFLLLKDMNPELLTPFLSKGIIPVLQDSVAPIGWFCDVVSIAFIIPFINKPKEARRYSILGIVWGATTLAFMSALVVMVFGPFLPSLLTQPTLEAVRYINLNDYIQRVQIIFLIPWMMANYILICYFYYITVLIISKWFKVEKPKTLILSIGLVIFTLSLVLFKNNLALENFLNHAWGFYSFPLELGIPFILLLIAFFRKKKGGKVLKLKKYFIALFLIVFFLSGCKDQMEIDRITFPITLGVDWNEKDKTIIVYAQISTLSSQTTGQAQTEKNYKVIQAQGKSIEEAMVNLTDHAEQNISWKHITAIIISNRLAEHGISSELDHFSRFEQIHLNSYLLITKDKLEDILGSTPKIESGLPSPIMGFSLISQQNSHSKTVTVRDFIMAYLSRENEPVLPLLSIYKLEEKQKQKEVEFDYRGLGVFKSDKLVGWLNEEETRGLLTIIGLKGQGSIVIKSNDKNSNIDMSLSDVITKTKIIPSLKQNKPGITLKILVEYDINELDSPTELDNQTIKQVDLLTQNYIKNEVEEVIKKTQKELKADIFGFGGKIYRKYPQYWYKNINNWSEIYSNIDVHIEVEAHLHDTGELMDSLKTRVAR